MRTTILFPTKVTKKFILTLRSAFRASNRNFGTLWKQMCAFYRNMRPRQKPFESAFIVFRKETKKTAGENYPQKQVLARIATPWTVAFEQGKGGPEGTVQFASLADWSKNSDAKIKYFSGTATYTNSFKLSKLPKNRVYIDLGKVMVLAKVKVNGKEAGGVWTAPYRLDITSLVKKGKNDIEVQVVNCWHNRIIGDQNLPESERLTKQCVSYLKKDSELQPSGLLGPVEIDAFNYQTNPE